MPNSEPASLLTHKHAHRQLLAKGYCFLGLTSSHTCPSWPTSNSLHPWEPQDQVSNSLPNQYTHLYASLTWMEVKMVYRMVAIVNMAITLRNRDKNNNNCPPYALPAPVKSHKSREWCILWGGEKTPLQEPRLTCAWNARTRWRRQGCRK